MITMRGIHKSFDRLEVLRGVDLDVRRGEILSIVGASGRERPHCSRYSALSTAPTQGR